MSLLNTAIDRTVLGLNRLPGTSLVTVQVLRASRVVCDLDTLHVHGEWSLAVVSKATGPLNGTRLVGWVTTGPSTGHDVHWSLWEALAVVWQDSSHDIAIDRPSDLVLCVFNTVGVVVVYSRARKGVLSTSVPGCGVTLGEPVGLNLHGVTSNPLKVNLIQVVTLKVEGRNNTLTLGSLEDDLDLTKHNVEV